MRLDQEPRFFLPTENQHQDSASEQAIAVVTAIKSAGQWQSASGKVSLFLDEASPNLTPGRAYQVTGMLQHPASHDPDLADHDRRHGIGAELAILHASGIVPIGETSMPLSLSIRQWARGLISDGFGSTSLNGPDHRGSLDRAILCQLLLGDHDPLSKPLQDAFSQSGTSWQLGISGLHIAIVAGLVGLIGRLLRFLPRANLLGMTCAAIAYATIADSGGASWRATLCCVVACGGLLTRRSVDAIQVFCVCLLAMLLVSPMLLFDAATQIGVAAVAGLILWSGPVRDMANWIPRDDVDVAVWAASMGRGHVSKWAAINAGLRAAGRWILGVLATSVVAFAATAPIIAYHFNEVSPWTPMASLILLPFTVVAMIAGLAKWMLTLLFPGLAGLWAWTLAFPVDLLRHVVGWLASWPGVQVKLDAVSIWTPIGAWTFFVALRVLLAMLKPSVGGQPR